EWKCQHDARGRSKNTISLFDNGSNPAVEKQSRALMLRVNVSAHKVSLVRAYIHPQGLLSGSQGNMQMLPKGHVFVGWGQNPWFTEFDAAGHVVFAGYFAKDADSYRAYRLTWRGRPATRPAIAARRTGGRVTVYASWNGATNIMRWQVLAGRSARSLKPVRTVPRTGFETAIEIKTGARLFAVRAVGFPGARATSAVTAAS